MAEILISIGGYTGTFVVGVAVGWWLCVRRPNVVVENWSGD